MSRPVLETERLELRRFDFADGPFLVELLNDEAFLRHIGDKGVRGPEDARRYLRQGPLASYERFGFGLWATVLRASGAAIGMCGLLKRDTLEHPDIGFAFLPAHRGRGFAFESAAAVLEHGRTAFGLERIDAIVSPGNRSSIRLLQKLGMDHQATVQLAQGEDPVELYAWRAPSRSR